MNSVFTFKRHNNPTFSIYQLNSPVLSGWITEVLLQSADFMCHVRGVVFLCFFFLSLIYLLVLMSNRRFYRVFTTRRALQDPGRSFGFNQITIANNEGLRVPDLGQFLR